MKPFVIDALPPEAFRCRDRTTQGRSKAEEKMKKECACKQCQQACSNKPGWFMPGEMEQAAKLLGMTPIEFFREKASVDWYENFGDDNRTVFVLSPATIKSEPGKEMPFDPKGRCRLLVDGRCSIHSAKPMECAEYIHTDSRIAVSERKDRLVEAWDKPEHQAHIASLLGRAPETAEDDGSLGFFGLGFGSEW